MAALFSFFLVLAISLIILRISTEILKLTGLSIDVARFQARSAFTGTGFSTRESESVMNHPVRRGVIMVLMFVRNIGFITLISSMAASFIEVSSSNDFLIKIAWLLGGMFLLFLISKIKFLDKILSYMVTLALKKWTKIHLHDYENLLNLSGEYEVIECKIKEKSWLANKNLEELRLSDEGLLVLGIKRTDGYFIGTPQAAAVIYPSDRVIIYGREETIRNISERQAGKKGDQDHEEFKIKKNIVEGKKIEEAGLPKRKKGMVKKIIKKIFKI